MDNTQNAEKGGESMRGPLSDITVLDVSRVLSGPFCTMLLADMGATVLKIENPGRGDMARRMGPTAGGESAYYMSVNRGKQSVALNIFTPEGQALFKRLAQQADVVVENYTPGTMKELGLDYGSLQLDNPRLVYASISGFGQDGPYAQRPALDAVVQAMGGIMSVTGESGGEPLRPGVSLGDSVAGAFTALAITAALHERHRTGRGQYIDMAMLDCQVTLLENVFSRYFATGETPTRIGSRHPAASPFQSFKTADGYIVVALLTDDLETWRRFCRVLGVEQLVSDSRFRDNRSRFANHAHLEPVLAERFATQPNAHWLRELEAAEVPCSPVNTIADVAKDPQVQYRGMIAEISHPTLPSWRVANTPFKFSANETGPQGASPTLGQHTESALTQRLGLSEDDLAALRQRGVI